MIVCIFGPSCVGKTTIARYVAAAFDLPLRSCGDAVREKAESLGLPVNHIADDVHRAVDAATIEWALRQREACILEGRFLDAVFAAARVPAIMIELRADRDCRIKRARLRYCEPLFSLEALNKRDAEDVTLRRRLFGRSTSDLPRRVLETSGHTVEECVRRVHEIIEAWNLCRENQRV